MAGASYALAILFFAIYAKGRLCSQSAGRHTLKKEAPLALDEKQKRH
jgi:hypothetical protein